MKGLFTTVCLTAAAVMLAAISVAALQQDVVSALQQLWPDPWFRVTLLDAYLSFLLFWLWVSWRERSASRSVLWLLLIMGLGSVAMAGYLVLHLRRWNPDQGIAGLLLGARGTTALPGGAVKNNVTTRPQGGPP